MMMLDISLDLKLIFTGFFFIKIYTISAYLHVLVISILCPVPVWCFGSRSYLADVIRSSTVETS